MTPQERNVKARSALEQSLEALKNSLDLVSQEARNAEEMYGEYPARLARIQGLVALEVAHQKAIIAIKEVLSAERVAQQNPQGVSNEQVEPTCWITPDGEGFRMRMTPPVNDVLLGWTPLFDHPPVPYVTPSRTAQPKPLTFEQVEDCFPEGPNVFEDAYGENHTSPRWLHAFARAIEAAHGITEE